MTLQRKVEAREDLVEFKENVAGHDGAMVDPTREIFYKPCTTQEIEFYDTAVDEYPDFADLMPTYMGSMTLCNNVDAKQVQNGISQFVLVPGGDANAALESVSQGTGKDQEAAGKQESAQSQEPIQDNVTWVPNNTGRIKTNEYVVLENLTHGYKKPNVLDVKLGKRLWSPDAPEQKKQRFDEITASTTHGTKGFRIAGMRVYGGKDESALREEQKSSGGNFKIDVDEDDEGSGRGPEYKIYGKNFGRYKVQDANLVDAFRQFIFNEKTAHIDEDLGRAVAQAFLRELERFEKVISRHRSEMFSSSLLFIFEGDGDELLSRIEESNPKVDSYNEQVKLLEQLEEVETCIETEDRKEIGEVQVQQCKRTKQLTATEPSLHTARVDSGISVSEDGTGEWVNGAFDTESTFWSEFQSSAATTPERPSALDMPKIMTLKLIDFAHATWLPESTKEPDENMLMGVRSLIDIFRELAA